jgi:hypothetical protein
MMGSPDHVWDHKKSFSHLTFALSVVVGLFICSATVVLNLGYMKTYNVCKKCYFLINTE